LRSAREGENGRALRSRDDGDHFTLSGGQSVVLTSGPLGLDLLGLDLGTIGAPTRVNVYVRDFEGEVSGLAQLQTTIRDRLGEVRARSSTPMKAGAGLSLTLHQPSDVVVFRLVLAGSGRLAAVHLQAVPVREEAEPELGAGTEHWMAAVPSRLRKQVSAEYRWAQLSAFIGQLERLDAEIAAAAKAEDSTQQQTVALLRGTRESLSAASGKLQAYRAEMRPRAVVRTPEAELITGVGPLAEGDSAVPQNTKAAQIIQTAVERFERLGLRAAVRHIFEQASPTSRASYCEFLALSICPLDYQACLRALWIAYGCDPKPSRAERVALRMFRCGDLDNAATLMRLAGEKPHTTFSAEARPLIELHVRPPALAARRPTGRKPRRGTAPNVAYVAASALPHQISGYTVRTHELLRSLVDKRVEVLCHLRPGLRLNMEGVQARRLGDHLDYELDDVPYWAHERSSGEMIHIAQAADVLESALRRQGATIVHAASNYRNALPALVAARRLGLPFVYEVRGLWELTRASKHAGWEATQRFELDRRWELETARGADHVLTISESLKAELVEAGVPGETVSILPNAVDPERHAPRAYDVKLAGRFGLAREDLVVFYAGSMVPYEGLDDLIRAVALARAEGVGLRLILVGDGESRADLERLTHEEEASDYVSFVGRVPPDEVQGYMSLADVIALPRKPFKVCEVVPPLKPFEAMAMGKAVVVSDLPALREVVRDGETGLVCRPADPAHLATVLRRLQEDRDLTTRLGEAGRAWVTANRTWSANAATLVQLYHMLG
jgi:glycosyltransferase involved in cell wall biosynthesis